MVKKITAAFVLSVSVIALLFAQPLGLGELTAEAYGFLGIIIGAASTFLFQQAKPNTVPQ